MIPRSYLYVPGDQPTKLSRAAERGADALILDLEDGVVPSRRDLAVQLVSEWLDAGDKDDLEVWVRVDPTRIDAHLAELVTPALTGICVPKAAPRVLARVDELLTSAERAAGLAAGSVRILALVETARGVLELGQIAALDRVSRMSLGEVDLAAELRVRAQGMSSELAPLRLSLVVHAAAARLAPPVGPVWAALDDLDGLRRSCESLRRLGYAGRAAIHPRQVAVINDAFTPTPEEVARARAVVVRFEARMSEGDGVTTDDEGHLIDEAVVRHAREVIAQADRYAERA